MSAPNEKTAAPDPRRPWQRPSITAAGTVGEILRGGNGKLSTTTGDPGEPRKVPGQDK